jgi:hypothetical protein
LFRDPDGAVHTLFTPRDDWRGFGCLAELLADDAPALVSFWGVVAFTSVQAKSLQRGLVNLWIEHYLMAQTNPADTATRGFVVNLGMAPTVVSARES